MMQSIEQQRQPCQIVTRVMGYFRPVSHYNIGKKSEFYSRTYFTEKKVQNNLFNKKYMVKESLGAIE